MKEYPILFSTPMVRALLEGRKTQTRRLLEFQPAEERPDNATWVPNGGFRRGRRVGQDWLLRSPYLNGASLLLGGCWIRYLPGDRLWVRESWAPLAAHSDIRKPGGAFYRAGHEEERGRGPRVDVRWRPSIHMPRWASRMTLVLTEVRVQRLQDISEADARAEGITDGGCLSCGCPEPCCCATPRPSARDSFAALWDSLHGPGAWAKNPEVVALSFTVDRTPKA